MKLTRPVTSLTADGVALEDRRAILVNRRWNRMNAVRVAIQAPGPNRPVEMVVCHFKTGRQIPPTLLRIPGEGRLEEKAVAFNEVRQPLPARAQHELHFLLVTGDDPPDESRRVS